MSISRFTADPRLLSRWTTWLKSVPITDPLDQRNAAMLRIVLIFAGIAQPLSTLPSAIGPFAWLQQPTTVALSMIQTAITWFCYVILRRGHLRPATHLFIGASLAFIAWSYVRWGLSLQRAYQLGQVYPVLVGGLLLSRRTLWLCAATLAAIFAVGAWRDLTNVYYDFEYMSTGTMELGGTLFSLFVITLILDRAVSAMRESLGVAVRRGNDLARMRDRMQLEIEEKERSREQVLHAQKLQAVGRLASGVAHDFNHLLALILGYVQVNRESKDVEQLQRAMTGIESAAKRANATLYKLLGFARKDLSRIEVFDAAEAVDDMRPIFAQLFDSNLSIVYDIADEALPISFDRAQFELALLNIATNANQAMPDGGRFYVGVRAVPHSAEVEIELADSGHGMSESVKQRIFEPFFTTKPVGQGTGLGLSTVREMVTANGGSIRVDSTPGAGATFRMRLPLATSTTRLASAERP
jgi:signal transduction histidine kinase